MLMTDGQIRQAIADGQLRIEGFDERCLQATSYDARIGLEVHVSHNEQSISFNERTRIVALKPGEFALLVTHEKFDLPMDIAANIGPKTYFTRKGLILLAGLQIDPGFKGALALAVFNSSPRTIVLEHMQEICTIQFFRLNQPATKSPVTNRDLLEGRVPRVDKDYFRDLETHSLTEIGKDLQRLASNVDQLTQNVASLSKSVAGLYKVGWFIVVPMAVAILGAITTVCINLGLPRIIGK